MKPALFWKKLKTKTVRCELCPRFCAIDDGEKGKCQARKNIGGKLYSLSYGKPASLNIDPIEKKPLYHFLPGSQSFSFGTPGCNLSCAHCQNWEISQASPEDLPLPDYPPERVVNIAKGNSCSSISYTYTEPTIFYEYMRDIAKLAKKNKLKNIFVSNGFINPEPLKQLAKYIDAANIDLKGPDRFYQRECGAWLEPVHEALKILKKERVWLEICYLIIPGENDSRKNLSEAINWIKKNLGTETPLHFSAFYPQYQRQTLKSTPIKTIVDARKHAIKAGLKYVYTGNIDDPAGSTTYCPKCQKPLVLRSGFSILGNNLEKGRCKFCGDKIAGVWQT